MYKKKVFISASSFASLKTEPLEKLKSFGFDVQLNPFKRRLSEQEIIDHLQGVTGLLAGLEPLNRKVLEQVRGNLKAIARIGIGTDNVDLQTAKDFGIKVSNTPDGPTRDVAEMTLGVCIALLRGLLSNNTAVHQKKWPKKIGFGLSGLPVLIIGYGRIGKKTASLFKLHGAKIFVYDPWLDPCLVDGDFEVVDLEFGLKKAKVVSLHAAGTDQIIGASELNIMPKGSIILNSARSSLINENALVDKLISGHLSNVWVDAFSDEPYTGKLCNIPNAILTPHISTYTQQCRYSMEMQAVDNLIRDLEH
jgi:D-3-phosphoglycerate dehydrogenase